MPALGQKQTCAVQEPMSALPSEATSNATHGMSAKAAMVSEIRSWNFGSGGSIPLPAPAKQAQSAQTGCEKRKRGRQRRSLGALLLVESEEHGRSSGKHHRQLAAKQHGWKVMAVYRDQGISGAKGRDKRPGLDRLMTAVARREITMVMAWSGVDLYLHQQGLDTSTPAGRAMFQMAGVFAEFERAMVRERVMSGLERAKAEGNETRSSACR